MKRIIDILEANFELSQLLEEMAAGEEIIIAMAGKPVAKLASLRDRRGPRPPGCLAGRFHVSENFDDPLDNFQ